MRSGVRQTAVVAGTALLFCFGLAETATADDAVPTSSVGGSDQAQDADALPIEETNDVTDWEDGVTTKVVEPRHCDGPSTWINITDHSNYFIPSWWNGTSYKDGLGGTMTVSVTKAGTISADMTVGAETELKAVVAKAKAEISVKVGGSFTITTGHTYSHEISKRKYGNLQYGSWGYKVSWTKYKSTGNGCDGKKVASGVAKVPTNKIGWKYWETST